MRPSARRAGAAMTALLILTLWAPSAGAVAPGRTVARERCSSTAERGFRMHYRYWRVTLIVRNLRNHRATVYGSWHVVTRHTDRTYRHHAELAPDTRAIFTKVFKGAARPAPVIDPLGCRSD
jgi:hypothetical protein